MNGAAFNTATAVNLFTKTQGITAYRTKKWTDDTLVTAATTPTTARRGVIGAGGTGYAIGAAQGHKAGKFASGLPCNTTFRTFQCAVVAFIALAHTA